MSEIEETGRTARAREATDALAAAMPRVLIAEGRAEAIAADWVHRTERAAGEGLPELPRYPLGPDIRDALFESRRAGQLVRGLEGAEDALASQELGLSRRAATQPEASQRRISRLLVVSADGSKRFYRGVARLLYRHRARLEAILVDCDEQELGAAAFGEGKRARALLLDHKDAVVRFLSQVDDLSSRAGEQSS